MKFAEHWPDWDVLKILNFLQMVDVLPSPDLIATRFSYWNWIVTLLIFIKTWSLAISWKYHPLV